MKKITLENVEEYIAGCSSFARSYKYHNDDDTLQLCADIVRLEQLSLELVRRIKYVDNLLKDHSHE